jgi:membrane associated rhomboid family serine protease/Flp pilus assembly protein TadD
MKISHLIMALDIGIFILMLRFGGFGEVLGFSARTLMAFGADYGPLVLRDHQVHRLLASTFIHLNALHLLMNMSALFWIGPRLEQRFGAARFAALYLISGVAGSAASIAWPTKDPVVSAGASGAICGLIGAGAVWGHYTRPEGKPLRDALLGWAGATLVFGAVIHADNAAHAGGLLAGALIGWALRRAPIPTRPGGVVAPILFMALIVLTFAQAARLRDCSQTAGMLVESGVERAHEGDYAGAFEAVERAIALEPDESHRRALVAMVVNHGVALARADRHDEAIAEYRRAIELEPEHAIAHYDLGLALARKDDHEAAIAAFERSLALRPDDAARHALVSAILQQSYDLSDKGKHDDAVALCRHGIAAAPNDERTQYGLGVALHRKGDDEAAAAAFRAALALDPSSYARQALAPMLLNRGVTLARERKDDEAIAAYLESIALQPDEPLAHYDLGLALERKGDVAGAARELEKSIELAKTADAYRALADVLAKLGRGDEARAARQAAAIMDNVPP